MKYLYGFGIRQNSRNIPHKKKLLSRKMKHFMFLLVLANTLFQIKINTVQGSL